MYLTLAPFERECAEYVRSFPGGGRDANPVLSDRVTRAVLENFRRNYIDACGEVRDGTHLACQLAAARPTGALNLRDDEDLRTLLQERGFQLLNSSNGGRRSTCGATSATRHTKFGTSTARSLQPSQPGRLERDPERSQPRAFASGSASSQQGGRSPRALRPDLRERIRPLTPLALHSTTGAVDTPDCGRENRAQPAGREINDE